MPELPSPLADLLERADATLATGGYHAVSVPTVRVRAWLRFRRLSFVDPKADRTPTLPELDRTAEAVIRRSRTNAVALSGAAGLGGAASIAPEVVGTTVAILRMAQRLCVVYGFDPETDRGKMALWRALAAAHDVDIPDTGPADLRLSDLRGVLVPRDTARRTVAGTLARAMVRRSLGWAVGRITRFLPVISVTTSAVDARRHIDQVGATMQGVLRRLAEVPTTVPDGMEDAHELASR